MGDLKKVQSAGVLLPTIVPKSEYLLFGMFKSPFATEEPKEVCVQNLGVRYNRSNHVQSINHG